MRYCPLLQRFSRTTNKRLLLETNGEGVCTQLVATIRNDKSPARLITKSCARPQLSCAENFEK